MEDLNKEEILELIDLSLQIKDKEWFKELSIMLNNTKKKDKKKNNVNLNVDYNDLEDNLKDVLNNTDIDIKDYDLEEYELDFDWNGKDVGFLIDGKIKNFPDTLDEIFMGEPVYILTSMKNVKKGDKVEVEFLLDDLERYYCYGYWSGFIKSRNEIEEHVSQIEKETDFLKSENKLLDRLVNTLENMLLNNCENDKKWWQFWKK